MRKYIDLINKMLDEGQDEEVAELLDNLNYTASQSIYKTYRTYRLPTNNYTIPATAVFSASDLIEIVEDIDQLYNKLLPEVDKNSQVYEIITVLCDYFIDRNVNFSITNKVQENWRVI
jgi:hypothetical protein